MNNWFLIILLFTSKIYAQSVINKRLSIQILNEKVETILNKIEIQEQVQFSYNPDHFDIDKVSSLECHNLMLKDALIMLLGNDIELKVIGNSTIILRSTNKINNAKKYKYDITGIIYDSYTGQKLSEVTVYQVDGVRSALSNESGKYILKVASNKEYVELAFSKKNYFNEVIIIKPSEIQTISVNLEPNKIEKIKPKTTQEIESISGRDVDSNLFTQFILPRKKRILIDNIPFLNDPQSVQISLLPTIGTNHSLNAAMNNKVSINVIAGYCKEINGVELGLLNVVSNDVNGAQFAGVGNIVGGDVNGFQASGVINTVKNNVNGGQFAWVLNYCGDTLSGVQSSGFMNYTNKTSKGAQLAGYLNVANQNFNGFQASGFLNIAADTLKKIQIAGFMNYSKYVDGVQISGFLNVARSVKGIQLGVINFADSVKGASIGLFSYVRKGYHPVEISYNELGAIGLKWKTGTRAFFNAIEAGIDVQHNNFWYYSYGIGHSFKLVNKFMFADLEINSSVINPQNGFNSEFNLLNRMDLLFSVKLVGPLYIFFGPSFNAHISENDYTNPFNIKVIEKISIENTHHVNFWTGYKFGLRI